MKTRKPEDEDHRGASPEPSSHRRVDGHSRTKMDAVSTSASWAVPRSSHGSVTERAVKTAREEPREYRLGDRYLADEKAAEGEPRKSTRDSRDAAPPPYWAKANSS